MTYIQAMIAVFMAVFLTVYGQIIIKWQVLEKGSLPESLNEKLFFLFRLIINPWILSGLLAAFVASMCWMIAMTKLDLNYAYPFVSLSFVLIVFLGALFFNEAITPWKVAGAIIIMLGVAIGSKG
jgi:drug/metabolite transporter (DMT)-like permease